MLGEFTNKTIQINSYYKVLYDDSAEITVRITDCDLNDIAGIMISINGIDSMYVSTSRKNVVKYLGSTLGSVMPELFI